MKRAAVGMVLVVLAVAAVALVWNRRADRSASDCPMIGCGPPVQLDLAAFAAPGLPGVRVQVCIAGGDCAEREILAIPGEDDPRNALANATLSTPLDPSAGQRGDERTVTIERVLVTDLAGHTLFDGGRDTRAPLHERDLPCPTCRYILLGVSLAGVVPR